MDPKPQKIPPRVGPVSPHDLARGAIIDGRYKIVAKLGTGGSAVVYEVEHARTGSRLALKMLLDVGDARRLEQEARATVKLRSLHVPRVVDLGNERGTPYLVMSLLEGLTLRSLLAERKKLPLRTVANIVLQVTECLEEAHRLGLVHRDLKPDNIHLRPVEGSDRKLDTDLFDVTVLDFGVVKMIAENETTQLTQIGSTVGTPYYMSLEQLRGSASIDGQSDVYSLSVVLYEALAGTVPFTAATLGDLVFAIVSAPPIDLEVVRPDVPVEIRKVVMNGLAGKKEERPKSMRSIAEAFLAHADPAFSLWLRGGATTNTAPVDEAETVAREVPRPIKLVARAAATGDARGQKVASPRPNIPETPSGSSGGPQFGGAAAKLHDGYEVGPSKPAESAEKFSTIDGDTTTNDSVPEGPPASTTEVSPEPARRDTPTEMFAKGVHDLEAEAEFPTMNLDVSKIPTGDATAVLPAQLPVGPLPSSSREDTGLGVNYAFVPPPTPSTSGAAPQQVLKVTEPLPTDPLRASTAIAPVMAQQPLSEPLRSQTFGELWAEVMRTFKSATPKQQIVVVAVGAALIATFFALIVFALLRH